MATEEKARLPRVMLVEDSIPFRKLLRAVIEESGSAEVVSEVGSAAAAHFLLHVNPVDVLVLDLFLRAGHWRWRPNPPQDPPTAPLGRGW